MFRCGEGGNTHGSRFLHGGFLFLRNGKILFLALKPNYFLRKWSQNSVRVRRNLLFSVARGLGVMRAEIRSVVLWTHGSRPFRAACYISDQLPYSGQGLVVTVPPPAARRSHSVAACSLVVGGVARARAPQCGAERRGARLAPQRQQRPGAAAQEAPLRCTTTPCATSLTNRFNLVRSATGNIGTKR